MKVYSNLKSTRLTYLLGRIAYLPAWITAAYHRYAKINSDSSDNHAKQKNCRAHLLSSSSHSFVFSEPCSNDRVRRSPVAILLTLYPFIPLFLSRMCALHTALSSDGMRPSFLTQGNRTLAVGVRNHSATCVLPSHWCYLRDRQVKHFDEYDNRLLVIKLASTTVESSGQWLLYARFLEMLTNAVLRSYQSYQKLSIFFLKVSCIIPVK